MAKKFHPSATGADKCVIPTCDRRMVRRGLCPSCSKQASNMVRMKKTTWKALEGLGLATPLPVKKVNGGWSKFNLALEIAKKAVRDDKDNTGT